jgi:hypothetical protein
LVSVGILFSKFGCKKFEKQTLEEFGKPVTKERTDDIDMWANRDIGLTKFDVSNKTLSNKNISIEEFDSIIQSNLFNFHMRFEKDGHYYTNKNRALALGGYVYLLNNHSVPSGIFELKMIKNPITEGVSSNIDGITVDPSMVIRFPEKDVAVILIKNYNTRKNISDWFCSPSLKGLHKAYYLGRDSSGNLVRNLVANVTHVKNSNFPEMNLECESWFGNSSIQTIQGDCGSILVARTPLGPTILGIHFLGGLRGGKNMVSAIKLDKIFIESLLKYDFPIIEPNGVNLNSESSINRNLCDLHPKSIFRYLDTGSVNLYGSMSGFKKGVKSLVCDTLMRESMEKRGYVTDFVKPPLSGYKPWRCAGLDLVNPVVKFNQGILKTVTQNYIFQILDGLDSEDLEHVHVIDMFTAINGAQGVKFVDKIKRNTSAGFPFDKSKRFFLIDIPPERDLQEPVDVSDEIKARIDIMLDNYKKGIRNNPIFKSSLKDEPIKKSKAEQGKVRVFNGSPLDFTIITRMFTLMFVALVQSHNLLFECCPGVNVFSSQWEDLYHHLTYFNQHNIIAGDYKAYDKRMGSIMISAAFDVILAVCEAANYTEVELKILKGICVDTCFSWNDFNGDLVEFFGSMPSGHSLTTVLNSIVGALYIRYVFYVACPFEKDVYLKNFRKYVRAAFYGDDNIMNVHDSISDWFNHSVIVRHMAEVGIEYTMADKTSESRPFVHISEAEFLKRSFVEYENFIFAPLNEASIIKSLMICTKSQSISFEHQCVEIIKSAGREYFMYGREKFYKMQQLLKDLVLENNLLPYVDDYTFLDFEEIMDDYISTSKRIMHLQSSQCSTVSEDDFTLSDIEDFPTMFELFDKVESGDWNILDNCTNCVFNDYLYFCVLDEYAQHFRIKKHCMLCLLSGRNVPAQFVYGLQVYCSCCFIEVFQ